MSAHRNKSFPKARAFFFILFTLIAVLATVVGGYKQASIYALRDDKLPRTSLTKIEVTGYKPQAKSEESTKGEELFKNLNCMACHSIHNVGGRYGPMLDGVGAHRDREYLLARLSRNEAEKEKFARMTNQDIDHLHHVRVSESSAKALVAFLLTLPEPPGGFVLSPHKTRLPSEAPEMNKNYKAPSLGKTSLEGKEIYDKAGCVACHSINKVGGWLGPHLDGIGGRHDRKYIIEHINVPEVVAQESIGEEVFPSEMPSFKLSEQDTQKIADYLISLPNAQ